MNILTLLIVILIYIGVTAYLGYKGYKESKNAKELMIGDRKVHPYVMAISYGATFISTAAIIGFGGLAARYGMSLLWLAFANIFVGVFIAFVFFGKRTRQMGLNLRAHTLPEFLGRRYNSKFIQGFSGVVIFIFMPLCTAAVLMGAARTMEGFLNINFNVSLFFFAIIVSMYVIFGGMKGVIYTDAFQGTIMIAGMIVLFVLTYNMLGGFITAHKKIANLPSVINENYAKLENETDKNIFYSIEKAFISKNAKDKPSLFINNTEFSEAQYNDYKTRLEKGDNSVLDTLTPNQIVALVEARKDENIIQYKIDSGETNITLDTDEYTKYKSVMLNKMYLSDMEKIGFQGWAAMPKTLTPLWFIILTSITLGVGVGVLSQPQLVIRFMMVKNNREINRAVGIGGVFMFLTVGVTYIVGSLSNSIFFERTSLIPIALTGGNHDTIIPLFITTILPKWFGYIFMLTILAAAMSTLSSQVHTIGVSVAHDVYETCVMRGKKSEASILISRVGMLIAVTVSIVLSYFMPPNIIATATSLFFGLTAATFLPSYIGSLYFKGITKPAVISSMIVGSISSIFWIVFVQTKEATLLGISKALFGKTTLASGMWVFVDSVAIALPLSIITLIVASFLTRKIDAETLEKIFFRVRK